jgi:predicted metal-binding membrane protein
MQRELNRWLGETTLVAVVGLAWVALAAWQLSPYRAYLSHEQLEGAPFGPSRQLGLLVVGWTLMSVAMMLPASLPYFTRARQALALRAGAETLLALVVAGYLLVWVLLGVALNIGDLSLHRATEPGAALHPAERLVEPLVFAVAGVWQLLSASRYYFYRPYAPRWAGVLEHPARGAFLGGIEHGFECAGSCWPLMLVMFAVGHGSLALMAILGAMLALQKNFAAGRQVRFTLGVLLLVQAGVLLLARFA